MSHPAEVRDFLGPLPSTVSVRSVPLPSDAPTIGNSTEGRTSMTGPNQKVYGGVDTYHLVHATELMGDTGTFELGLHRILTMAGGSGANVWHGSCEEPASTVSAIAASIATARTRPRM